MKNIFRGEYIDREEMMKQINSMDKIIKDDLLHSAINPNVVIEAANILVNNINKKEVLNILCSQGIPKWDAEDLIDKTIKGLEKDYLMYKVRVELGENPFEWKEVEVYEKNISGIKKNKCYEKFQPMGVLLHIASGNAVGLPALSVIEGLLSGNINVLKLPSNEIGLSSLILMELIKIEPRLKPYIYVLDISSKDIKLVNKLMNVVNGVVVWGSDEAITSIRQLTPPNIPIIEWGHKLSFAYFAKKEKFDIASINGLAKDICLSEQLYCSAPQAVFYETDDAKELELFAGLLDKELNKVSDMFPPLKIPINEQAQITWELELFKMEELIESKKLIQDKKRRYNIMIDFDSNLKASPLFRNIWVMPIKRNRLYDILINYKGYLQTVGLSCMNEDVEEISEILYKAGVNRITTCGNMNDTYSGEPHDGMFTLNRYVRVVNRYI